jgi:hypothetical protein
VTARRSSAPRRNRRACTCFVSALATRTAERVITGGSVSEFDFAGGTTAYICSDMQTPPSVYAGEDGVRRKIERFNDALLGRFKFGATEEVRYKGFGGNTVQMWLVFPPGFDPKRKYPLLHSIHGGPHTASSDGWHFRWSNQAFAAQGYIVVAVNYHGSSSFGPEVHRFDRRRIRQARARRRRGGDRPAAEAPLCRSPARIRHRRQLRRLHGRVDERPRPPGQVPGVRLPRGLLRLGFDVRRRHLHVPRPRVRRVVLEGHAQGRVAESRAHSQRR